MPAFLLRRMALLLALASLAACGGGGGSSPPVPISLGVLPSTVASTVPQVFRNPLDVPATVSVALQTGPFALHPDDVATSVPASGDVSLRILFDPASAGTHSGTLALQWAAGGQQEITQHTFTAVAEAVAWSVVPASLDFGVVAVGTQVTRSVQLRNNAALSPVTLTGASFPGAGLSIDGSPFPVTLAPGAALDLTVRYAPTGPGSATGTLQVGPADRGGPVGVPISASTPGTGSEDVVDFGVQTFSSGNDTAQLSVSIPADCIAFTIEASGGTSHTFGLGELIGPGDVVYENTSSTGNYIWLPKTQIFTTQVPNTDRAGVQLVAGGGTYRFRVRRLGGGAASANVRVIIERRPGGTSVSDALDLNVFLANAIVPTAATAASDARLQAILNRMDLILGQQGIRIGDVDYYDVTNPAFDDVSDAEFGPMLATTSVASEERLNLFFVRTAIGGGVVGVSATLGGPKRNGTTLSGVMSIYDSGFSTNTVGLIAAHEVGHFLGLFHTVEQNGAHDFVDDTPNCPASGTNGTCPTVGGGLLMHWQAVGGTDITNGQGLIIRGHPLVDPAAATSPKRALPLLAFPDDADKLDAWRLPAGWCGTCRDAHR